jgi:hypothetical protein
VHLPEPSGVVAVFKQDRRLEHVSLTYS